jgi:hypothetical protein
VPWRRNLAAVNRLALVLVALLLGLSLPAIASAQLGPTNVPAPLTQPEEEVAAPVEEDTGVSTFQLVLIFGAAIGVIALIAWVIMRDARTAAPAAARHQAATDPAANAPGAKGHKSARTAREREREKARKRKQAKAARDQRKRNRPH